jgi:serine/threonine-protein kinase SRPK3
MTDTTKPHFYRVPRLDHLEDIEKYRPGGYHPVNLDDILDGKYKVIHKLGHGGFATIWLARVLQDNRYVALKILTANASNQELTILTYLRDHGANHCNIACLRNAFTIRGPNGLHQCLVLDFVGPSLKQIANGKHNISGLIARNAARQVTEGLAHLHSTGLCHGGKTLLMP